MKLLDKKRKDTKVKAPKRAQIKLDHMRNDINRTKIVPSKNISLMYCYNNNINNVVIMEKDKKSVSILPVNRMNELRIGETGVLSKLSAIHNKISMNQVKNVHSGYNKYWTYGGAIYGVKPGYIGRLDTGSTPSATNVYDWNLVFCFNGNKKSVGGNSYQPYFQSDGDDRYYQRVGYCTSWQAAFYVSDYRVGGKELKLKSTLNRCWSLYNSTDPIRPGNLVINLGYEEHTILDRRNIKHKLPIVMMLPYIDCGGHQYRLEYEVGKRRFKVVCYNTYRRTYYVYPNISFEYLFAMDADWIHNRNIHQIAGFTGEWNFLANTNNNYGLGFGCIGGDSTMNGRHGWDANNGYPVWWDNVG